MDEGFNTLFSTDDLNLFPPSEQNGDSQPRSEILEMHATVPQPIPLRAGDVMSVNDYDYLKERHTLSTLTLTKLYQRNYLPSIRFRKENEKFTSLNRLNNHYETYLSEETLKCGDVVQTLKQMNTFFHARYYPKPTPFSLLNYQIILEMEEVEKMLLRSSDGALSWVSHDSALKSDVENEVEVWESQLHGDGLLVGVNLSNLSSQTTESLRVLLDKLRRSSHVASDISPALVRFLLHELLEWVQDKSVCDKKKCILASIVGIIVTFRGELGYILFFLKCLEQIEKNQTMSAPLFHTMDIVNGLSLKVDAPFPQNSPIDCLQEEEIPLSLLLNRKDGVLERMAVNADGTLVAAVIGSDLVLLKRHSGEVVKKKEILEECKPCWNIIFSALDTTIILTHKSGLVHCVYSLDLQLISSQVTSGAAVPFDYMPEQNKLLHYPPPFLSSGSPSTLYLFQSGNGIKKEYSTGTDDIKRFTLGAYVSSTFDGSLLTIETCSNEMLAVTITDHVLHLSAYGHTCRAALCLKSTWIQLHVQWIEGRWIAYQNGISLELHGMCQLPPAPLKFRSTNIFEGKGHIACLALWCSKDAAEEIRAVNFFFRRSSNLGTSKIFFYFPLDEGKGFWLKDLAAQESVILNQAKCYVWDCECICPTLPQKYPCVQLRTEDFLCRSLLCSAYSIYLLPPDDAGDRIGCTVTEVDRKTNTIVRLYQCLPCLDKKIYAIQLDESELFVCEPRFLAFRTVKLHSRKAFNQHLSQNYERHCDDGTPGWLLDQLCKKIAIYGFELQHGKHCLFDSSVLKTILNELETVSAETTSFRLIVLLSLASAHFKAVLVGKIQTPKQDIKTIFERILFLFKDNTDMCTIVTRSLELGMRSICSMSQKCSLFFSAVSTKNWNVFFDMFSGELLLSTLQYAVERSTMSEVSQFTMDLLQETEKASSHPTLSKWVTFYVLALVQVLVGYGKTQLLANIAKELCIFIDKKLDTWANDTFSSGAKPQSVLITAVLPFFSALSYVSTDVVDVDLGENLYALLRKLRCRSHGKIEKVVFECTSLHELSSNPLDSPWCFTLDFSDADSVLIQKDDSSPSFSVLSQGKRDLSSSLCALVEREVTVKGDVLILAGRAQNFITTISNYSIDVNVSLNFMLLQSIEALLLSVARSSWLSISRNTSISIPLAFRHGLASSTLHRFGIDLPYREAISTYSKEILEGVGKGKDLTDSVCHSMRGGILPSMKPAIQSLLSILIHCGATEHEAEKELRLNWFSGNWGINFQGPKREPVIKKLREISEWVVGNVHFDKALSSLSRSPSKLSQTVSSYHTTVNQFSVMKDLLVAVRTSLSREEGTEYIEKAMALQTKRALNFCRGTSILCELVRGASGESEAVHETLILIHHYIQICGGFHVVESVFGSGLDLEQNVRVSFHMLLKELTATLFKDFTAYPSDTIDLMTGGVPNGFSLLSLLALHAYPWDEEDYSVMVCGDEEQGSNDDFWMIESLRVLLRLPFDERSTDGSVKVGDKFNYTSLSETALQILRRECIAAVQVKSIGLSSPNNFSIIIPQIRIISSKDGHIIIRKNSESRLLLRADEPWATSLEDANIIIQYFEIRIETAIPGALFIGLTSGNVNPEEASANFIFAISNEGKIFPFLQDECVPLQVGDILGCGLDIASRKVFYTRNGFFWRAAGVVPDVEKKIFPSLLFSENSGVELSVNFGGAPFAFDHSQMHPTLSHSGPTWYNLFCAAESAFYSLTSRVCSVPTKKDDDDAQYLKKICCEVACEHVNVVSKSLTRATLTKDESRCAELHKPVMFKVGKNSLLLKISTLRKIFRTDINGEPIPPIIGSAIYNAISLIMNVPFHSTLVASLRLLRDAIDDISDLPEVDCVALVKTLFIHAEKEESDSVKIPFNPCWEECDPQNAALMTNTYALTLMKSKVSVVVGTVLPDTGEVSFSVTIQKQNCPKGRSLQSGYYIGVAKKDYYPSDVLQTWKAKRPPVVWAIHDVSPQLPHATNPTVQPNSFMRAYGSSENITVQVNRTSGTVAFFREGKDIGKLFVDIPSNIDLVPFVQLYNDNASVNIYPGTMTAPITETVLLSAVSIDVLRRMLRVSPFDKILAKYIKKEMSRKTNPKVTFAVLNGLPNPRVLQLTNAKKSPNKAVEVVDVDTSRYFFVDDTGVRCDFAYKFRVPIDAFVSCWFDVQPQENISGYMMCIEGLVEAFSQHAEPIVSKYYLMVEEINMRSKIINEEGALFDILSESMRLGEFRSLCGVSPKSPSFTPLESQFVFSTALSNPHMNIMAQYVGKLVKLQNNAPTLSTFIGICHPAIPDKGRCNLRCRIRRNEDSHTLGGGYYFGVCTETFSWKYTDFVGREENPQVWALHDADTAIWRLKHMKRDTTFDDNICFYSGDTIRLEIDRDSGTMDAFRKPFKGDEIFLGRIFENIPVEPLRIFVCLYNNDASAVLLTSESDRVPVRVTEPQLYFSVFDYSQKVFCSSCSMNQVEEVQLFDEWYKCNECVNYALCAECFFRCIHPQHSFTSMNGKKARAHCPSPPLKLRQGMNVFIPWGPAMYLKSNDCILPQEFINGVAISTKADGFVCWGLVGGADRFDVCITSVSGRTLSNDSPVFVGISSSEAVLSIKPEEYRSFMLNGASLPESDLCLVCSDPFIDARSASSTTYGFSSGCTISFRLDEKRKAFEISKDWISHRVSSVGSKIKKDLPLFCFVLFGAEDQKATLYPDQCKTSAAIVSDVKDNMVTLKVPHFGIRVVPMNHCRVPLIPFVVQKDIIALLEQRKKKVYGYFFDSKQLVHCQLLSVSGNYVDVQITSTGAEPPTKKSVFQSRILVDPYQSETTPLRKLNSSAAQIGPTVSLASTIFKILLILSCMCQNDVLATIVSRHKSVLLPQVEGLSSVLYSGQTNLGVVESVRCAIKNSSLWRKVRKHGPQFLYQSIVLSEKANNAVRDSSLVFLLNNPKFLYRIVRCFNGFADVVCAETQDGTAIFSVPQELCVPIKQCAGQPWYLVQNGLPSSKRERANRCNLGNSCGVTGAEGNWRGAITTKSCTLRMELQLNKEGIFNSEASLIFRFENKKFRVYYEYYRYERYIRIIMLEDIYHDIWQKAKGKKWNDILSILERHNLSNESVYIIKGVVEVSGMQFTGSSRLVDGTVCSVFGRLMDTVHFSPSNITDIDVLPDCEKMQHEYVPPEIDVISTLRNTIAMLSRHLYLILCHQTHADLTTFASRIELFSLHPLALALSKTLSRENIFRLMRRASILIQNPSTQPTVLASLSKFIMLLLLNKDFYAVCPTCFLWDSMYAVVFAAHKCGPELRPSIIELLTRFVATCPLVQESETSKYLLSPLFLHANNQMTTGKARNKNYHANETSAIIELLLELPFHVCNTDIMEQVPISTMRCLLDLRSAIENGKPIPSSVDVGILEHSIGMKCLFGELEDQNFLKVGKIVGDAVVARAKVYFEVVFPKDEIGTYAVGWGTEQHRRAADTHVGTDSYSFAFLGTTVCFAGSHQQYDIPSTPCCGVSKGTVVGCLLDLSCGIAAWSRNGEVGRFISIPENHLRRDPLFAFSSINGGSGLLFLLDSRDFLYPPEGYSDITGRSCRPSIPYSPLIRSNLPIQSKQFYVCLSSYLSLRDSSRLTRDLVSPVISDFPPLTLIDKEHISRYERVIAFIEHGVHIIEPFVDLDREKISGNLSSTFLYFKPVLREFSRLRLVNFTPLTPVNSAKDIVIRVDSDGLTQNQTYWDYFSHTVLYQCYKELEDLTDEQWSLAPLFRVRLYLSGSGHSPIDMGGPYRQTWSLIAQEIMRHPEKFSDTLGNHRQPLFRFCNNSMRISLVPDETMNSATILPLFSFFGKLMGYAAKAQLSLDIELSPFVWKFMVDDVLHIQDYYAYVDSVIKSSMEDSDFFVNGMAEELISGLAERIVSNDFSELSSLEVLQQKQLLAQECLIHSMDIQLKAMRSGLWKILSRRVLRCLYWKDLEELVCGVSNPSVKDLQKYIKCNMSPLRESNFWSIVSEMTPEQKSSLLCFASGQRRLPLIRCISIVENAESEDHLPRAQSCSSLITIPQYQSIEKFKDKLLHAIQHQNEMELA